MENSMYQRLLMLPVFNGLTTAELTQIIAQIHLDFNQHGDGDILVAQDDRCDRLLYILSGTVLCEYTDPDNHFVLTERMDQPFIVEPANLYGMSHRYTHTYRTLTPTDTVAVNKRDFSNIMLNYHVVRTNILNMLCAQVQRLTQLSRMPEPVSVRNKIILFLRCHITTSKGEKEIRIKMEDLSELIQETRLNVSLALRELKGQGLILQPGRGLIHIPDMEKLLAYQSK